MPELLSAVLHTGVGAGNSWVDMTFNLLLDPHATEPVLGFSQWAIDGDWDLFDVNYVNPGSDALTHHVRLFLDATGHIVPPTKLTYTRSIGLGPGEYLIGADGVIVPDWVDFPVT